MSESTNSTTKEEKDPVEKDEAKPGGSRDDGKEKRTSNRKRKASTSDPVALADEVKAKLKVKISSKKKKGKKSSKVFSKKSIKDKSPKEKKKTGSRSKKARTEPPVEVPQDASVAVHNELLPPEVLICTTAEVHNEMNSAEIVTDANIEICSDLTVEVAQLEDTRVYEAQEPLQSIDNEDDKKEDQDFDSESCNATLAFTDAESETSRSNYEKFMIDTQNRSNEFLLGFNSKLKPELTMIDPEAKEVREDQEEAMDICKNASNCTKDDLDSEKTMIEVQDTIIDEALLDFNNKQELQLAVLATETVNANPVELNQQKDVEVGKDDDEAMDTCEDFNKDLLKENIEANENEEIDVCGDNDDAEEVHHAMELTEVNADSSNKHTDEGSKEQNKIIDSCKHEQNQESKSLKIKTLKLKTSKSSKQSSSKSSKSRDRKKSKNKSRKDSTTATTSPDPYYKVNKQDDISCRICEQTLNYQLKFYTGEPENGYDEELAIIDSRLLLFNGDEENISREDTRAYNKITSFSVYCNNGHLCPFDSGLIERDVEIYFSGYVKPIYSDDPSIENGVPGKNFGPIVEWWSTGFDIGEQPTVAISTEIGDYILMEPSDEYKPFMHSVLIKILIGKIVIEYLVYEPHATYEDLLNKLQSASSKYDILPNMTEDVLLEYAPFIYLQVMSYDETAKLNEPLMLVAPCIRRLIDLAGISFKVNRGVSSRGQFHKYQERRAGEYRKELLRKVAENRGDNSITSQLIDSLLPDVEEKLITLSKPCTRDPCGSCDRCQRSSCKECEPCSQKNYEDCPRRRCFYREIQEANDEDAKDSVNLSQLKGNSSISVFKKTINIFSSFNAKLEWLGDPLIVEGSGNTFYAAVKHEEETVCVGDFVLVRSVDQSVPAQVVKIAYMWEDNVGLAHFHANLYWWGKDTVLGELARPNELFSINKCNNISVNCITERINIDERYMPRNQDVSTDEDIKANNIFCEKSYDPSDGSFHDLTKPEEVSVLPTHRSCINCEGKHRRSERVEPRTVDELGKKEEGTLYRAVIYKDEEYIVGSCVYLKPKSLYFQFPMLLDHAKSSGKISKKIDEEKYPELYRKAEDAVIDSKFDMPAPFDIGYITEIFTTDKLYIKVKKLYRPENTHRNEVLIKQNDMNMLYWSNEVCTVSFNYVVRKCYVAHIKDFSKSVEEWSNLGPDRFYFMQMYHDKKFTDIERNMYGCEDVPLDPPIDYPDVDAMTSLEIFAGCGGLSLGLRESGVIKKLGSWAIESDVDAANTFQLNNPDITVLVGHPDIVLKNAMKGEFEDSDGKLLPRKDDVEFLCATLPCENYKTMTDITVFKHSYIATFLSYCDYYKPSLFILEADEKLIKRSFVLKLTLACLVSMGYQVTFDLMQVGCYGAPQNRRRSVLLGAAPDSVLPKFPERLHVFPKPLCELGIVIDSKKYTQDTFWTESAPYRSVTVQDALIDLPTTKVAITEEMNYDAKSTSLFSKIMRLNMLEPTVFNHVCKDLGPLVECRISQIPLAVGSDWRNLPNIEMQLKDESYAKKLIYNYDDVEAGKSSNGELRGVCSCASGERCDPRDRQHGCLIPWHLVHSARKNKHWAGIYSRLQWDGFFNGAITNPQPLGTQGPVLHPTQPRVVSVRECARAQGFPDEFVLPQKIGIHNMYRIIGRASSPFLGRAIGHEIARSLAARHRK
ncbi:DNA (cytosine-5)-methyltransferase 1 [Nasonia vitripennis]|uniref:DNA (cytosine-5)-methyltransferase n=1 Tax=Nasonia vitripennis TaxID=7425 RepID=A0A7M7H161_NASVI|nr:DNA (cytosine-5)-methyltransferase 1 [Nasonia vitripennis]XP_008202943.1 DNA (cytosine-5)-methyltransferase 1 [Nasonia vitripennis]